MPVTDAFLQALPKCEHHLHIEGTLTPDLLFTLAARNSIPLPLLPQDPDSYRSPEALQTRYDAMYASLDDFLAYFIANMAVLRTALDFADLAWAYLQRAHADGVAHAELSFDPQTHIARGLSFETVLGGLETACARAESELGMSTSLICCFVRHFSAEDALQLFETEEVQRAIASGRVDGIGLSSSETLGTPSGAFVEVYKRARDMGVRVTAHAGEEGPASNVTVALNDLGCVDRIDHGVKTALDEGIMREVVSSGTMLTVCPVSNVVLKGFQRLEDVPLRKFLNAGVKFSVNSDDPSYMGAWIGDVYREVQRVFGLTVGEWEGICEVAIKGSWCGDERKGVLLKRLKQVAEKYS